VSAEVPAALATDATLDAAAKTHVTLLFVPVWNACNATGVDFPYPCWFMTPTRRLDEA
jgi:hypothetical protein